MATRYQCSLCSSSSSDLKSLLAHYSKNHLESFNLTCNIDNCQGKYTSVRTYKNHLNRKHKHVYSYKASSNSSSTHSDAIAEDVHTGENDQTNADMDAGMDADMDADMDIDGEVPEHPFSGYSDLVGMMLLEAYCKTSLSFVVAMTWGVTFVQ